jgi:hypothetical protein
LSEGLHASGWREQKFRISDTVAEAADTASVALIAEPGAEADEVSFEPPLGKSIRTTPSQNATRNKNIMVLPFGSSPRPKSLDHRFCLSPEAR